MNKTNKKILREEYGKLLNKKYTKKEIKQMSIKDMELKIYGKKYFECIKEE